jgi:hypothetical protein
MNALVFLMLLQAATPAEPEPEPFAIRVRGGVEAGPGLSYAQYQYLLPGGSIVGRIGLQITPIVALVYQGGLAFYGGEATFDDIIESPSYFMVQSTPMVIVTPVDFFELGAGPAVDGVIGDQDFDTGVALGVGSRVGFHIPLGPQEERRFGLGIAFDFRPVYLLRELNPGFWLLHSQLGVGVDWY